jgi:hypothetical protein
LEYIMPLLSDQTVTQKASYRVKTAGTKLNRDELAELAKHCSERGTTPGELIRQLILTELRHDDAEPTASPELSEIVGIRLMLTNVLKPLATGQKLTPEVFDGIMVEVKRRKRAVAVEAQLDLERA